MKIRPTKVANVTYLHRRIGADCDEHQQYRELLINAIEAGANRVVFDVVSRDGVSKLRVVDDGCGMSPDEASKYIGDLASSGKTQSLHQNQGNGAKITAGLKNPVGLEYETFDGRQHSKLLYRLDEESDQFGLTLIRGRDGIDRPFELLDGSNLPDIIRTSGHGTAVTLLGETACASTVEPQLPR